VRKCIEEAYQRWEDVREGVVAAASLAGEGHSAQERHDGRKQALVYGNAVWAELRETLCVACAVGQLPVDRQREALAAAHRAREHSEEAWKLMFHQVYQAAGCDGESCQPPSTRFLPLWSKEQCNIKKATLLRKETHEVDDTISEPPTPAATRATRKKGKRFLQAYGDELFLSRQGLTSSTEQGKLNFFGSFEAKEYWNAVALSREEAGRQARMIRTVMASRGIAASTGLSPISFDTLLEDMHRTASGK